MIKVEIYAKNIKLTEELKKYILEKTDHLQKFIPKDKEILVAIEVSKTTNHHKKGDVFYAEYQIDLPGKYLRATATREDLESAVLEAKSEAEREIKGFKEKNEAVRDRRNRFFKKILSISPLARFKRNKHL